MPTYIITGSNRGLGLEFVRQFSATASTSNPVTVIACVRSHSSTDLSALKSIQFSTTTPATVTIAECSPSSQDSIKAFVAQLPSPSELPTPVILLNNAGINAVPNQDSLHITRDDMMKHVDINVLGPAVLVSSLLEGGYLSKGSVVFNMTSGMGSMGRELVGDNKAIYAISKAALNMLSCHQAKDLEGKGVKVLVMDPGWVKTVSSIRFPRLAKEVVACFGWRWMRFVIQRY
jgi:NAD(P)-dependent dehydrogenase (short-subunit alcohol dehydrogenase family)